MTARARRVSVGVLLLALVALATVPDCAVVAWKYGRIESTLRDAGLAPDTLAVGTAEIHYWAGGTGPAVLLVHGFGASAPWQWYEQVEALAPHHRVIMPDLSWFGESHDAAATPDFGIDRQVELLVALLDHLGVAETAVVGVSYGGLVATELADAHPARVTRLVLLDSPGRVYTRADWAALCKRFGVEHMGTVLVPTTEAGVDLLLALAYDDPPWSPEWADRQVLEELYGSRREEKVALIDRLLVDMDRLAARPSRSEAPTLLIWGRNDPVFPIEIGERLQRALGDRATLRVIEHARHAPMLEHPDEVNALLSSFLDGP